jgi:hypothetical protein
MFSVRRIAARQLFARNTYALGFGSKRKATPADLEKYDVVVVGAGLGNVFASHLDAVVGDKHKIYVAYDNPVTYYTSERGLYETGSYLSFYQASPNSISALRPGRLSAKITPNLITSGSISSIQRITKSCLETEGQSSIKTWSSL